MSDIAIQVDNLSKRYRIGLRRDGGASYGSLRETIAEAARAPVRRLRSKSQAGSNGDPEYIWALKDVSFEVKKGEVVGIIGRNGAGKTTLLKVLSRITRPTRGDVRLWGRVGSLLEVGTGFHPELTGRENIYLNGAVLGMKRSEIERKFDEIVDFAEIEQFLDTPVKRYSSGMYMRLAFAVAAHLEPEILLVDEVLAVGDAAFQKKCLGKMGEVAREGRTVLFVSHNMAAVKNLCPVGVLLASGMINYFGDVSTCVNNYVNSINPNINPQFNFQEINNLPIQLIAASIETEEGNLVYSHSFKEPFRIKLKIIIRKQLSNVYIAVHVHDENLDTILFSRDFETDKKKLEDRIPGTKIYSIKIPPYILVPGTYSISVHIAKSAPPELISGENYICPFEIVDTGSIRAETGFPWVGKVAVPLKWEVINFSSKPNTKQV